MKKFLSIAIVLGFISSSAIASASILSETNKALDKANTTMNTVNTINNNIEYAKSQNTETARAQAKTAAKNAAKAEAKKQTNSFWDWLFRRK